MTRTKEEYFERYDKQVEKKAREMRFWMRMLWIYLLTIATMTIIFFGKW